MKKLLVAILLFISTLAFAQTPINWTDYWTKELPKVQESVQVIDKNYQVKIHVRNLQKYIPLEIINTIVKVQTSYLNIILD